jgi:AP-4 complex subunit epsilon-1
MSVIHRELQELVRLVGEAKSKQEEDRVILREITILKERFADKDMSTKRFREFIVRLIYVDMLGQDASFGLVKAINLTQQKGVHDKRTGYLASSLLLSHNPELLILLVNSMQRDLRSMNPFEVAAALGAMPSLITLDLIPAIKQLVLDCVAHSNSHIRKKAVAVLLRFVQLDPGSIDEYLEFFRNCLCDRDPAVMGASLNAFYVIASMGKDYQKGLLPVVTSLVSILKQIVDHKLPRDFDYHRMPAPWLQIKICQILAFLGSDNQSMSQQMYQVLEECLSRADSGTTMGYAIMSEAVKTVTSIYPHPPLIQTAANCVSKIFRGEGNNLRFIALDALSNIVSIQPSAGADHQNAVIDCLQDADEMLQRKTLDLLFKMTNPANVEFIVDQMSTFLKSTTDPKFRKDLVSKITSLAEKFSPNNAWFMTTMNFVFEVAGDLVDDSVAQNLMLLVADGSGDDEAADDAIRRLAVNSYVSVLSDPDRATSETLLRVASWILGEYGYLSTLKSLSETIDLLSDVVLRSSVPVESQIWIVSAITKLCAQHGSLPQSASSSLRQLLSSSRYEVARRANEALVLLQSQADLSSILPVDASSEDLEVLESMPFLESIVSQSLAQGGRRYNPPHARAVAARHNSVTGPALRFDAYEAPQKAKEKSMQNELSGVPNISMSEVSGGSIFGPAPTSQVDDGPVSVFGSSSTPSTGLGLGLGSGSGSAWGSSGYTAAQEIAPAPVVSSSVFGSSTQMSSSSSQSGQAAPSAMYSSPANPSPAFDLMAPPKPRDSELPKVDTKRTSLANSLFAGVSSSSSPSIPVSSGASLFGTTAQSASTAASPPVQRSSVPSAAPQVLAAQPTVDLLGMDDLLGSSPAVSSSTSGYNTSVSGSIFGTAPAAAMPAASGSIFASAPSVSSSSNPSVSVFDELILGGPVAASSAGPAQFATTFASEVQQFESLSSTSLTFLGQDSNAAVQFVIGYAAAETVALIHVRGQDIIQAELSIDSPGIVSASFQSGRSVKLGRIPNNGVSMAPCRLSLSGPIPRGVLECSGVLSYALVSGFQSRISFKLPISVCAFLRPNQITTQQFGSMWGSHASQCKFSAPSTRVSDPASFASIGTFANLYRVEIIKNEIISSAILNGERATVLVHAKTGAGVVEIIVRSNQQVMFELCHYSSCSHSRFAASFGCCR